MAEEKATQKSFLEKISSILLVLTIVLAFFVGILWQKLNAADTSSKVDLPPLAAENLKSYAKELKLNTKQFNSCLDDAKYYQAVKDDMSYAEKVGIKGTPAFFINGKFVGGAFPYAAFKEIIDKELDGTSSEDFEDYSEQLQQAYSEEDPTRRAFEPVPVEIELGDAPVKGGQDAKVTILEFSDFECPYCGFFYEQTLGQIMSEYVDTGKAKIAFMQFPLTSIHKNAQKAAEASLCAGEQGKFWEFHDKMFESVNEANKNAQN